LEVNHSNLLFSKYPDLAFQTLFGLAEFNFFKKDYIMSFSILQSIFHLFGKIASNLKKDAIILTLEIVFSFVLQRIKKEGIERNKFFLEGMEKLINISFDEEITDCELISSNILLMKIISDYWMVNGIFLNDTSSLYKSFWLHINKIINISQTNSPPNQLEKNMETLQLNQFLEKLKNVNEKVEETILRDVCLVSVLLGLKDPE
jgi:hypothetical protein